MRKLLALLPILWLWSFPVAAQQWLPGGQGTPIVCAYNSSPPTVATGLFIYAQCDTNGKLITSGSGGGSSNVAITAPLGHTTADVAAVSIVPSATAAFPISGSLTANQSVNVAQAGGTNLIGTVGTIPNSADPCSYVAKTSLAISGNATALTQIIAASGSTKIYVCSLSLVAAGATAFNLNTGTGTNCGSTTAALLGSLTAANGLAFAQNGGITLGNGGATVLVTAASSEICTLQSNAVYVSGSMTYVQQ